MGILGSEMGCILAMVLWNLHSREEVVLVLPAITSCVCLWGKGKRAILRSEIWAQDCGRRKALDLKQRLLGEALQRLGVIGHSPLVSLAPSLPCERERQHKKPTVLMAV